MAEITIEVDKEEVKKMLGDLSSQADKVIARAVNRTYSTGKVAIARETQKKYRITQKEINSTLKIKKATKASPNAVLRYTDSHKNLSHWNNGRAVKPNKVIKWTRKRRGRGAKPNVRTYKAAVMKGPAKKLEGKFHNKPFLQEIKNGRGGNFIGLFQRKYSLRDSPLVSVQAPAIPQIVKNEEVLAQFRRAAGLMLQKRLEHEIDVVLKGVVK